jgi:hypothetical protein
MTPTERNHRLRRANELIERGADETDAYERAGLLSARARDMAATPDDFTGICRWFEGVAPLLASELADSPFYVVAVSDAGAKWGGLFAPTLAEEYRAEIGDRWRGPGPAIAINASLWSGADPLSWEWSRVLIGVLLHELAHVIAVAQEVRCLTPPAPALSRELTEGFLLDAPIRCGAGAVVPWADHGAEFIRAALHLHARAERLGIAFLRSHLVVDCNARGLSETEAYAEALGSEPKRYEGWTFEDISNCRPPEAFVSLWRRDVRRVFLSSPASDSLTAAFVSAVSLFPVFERTVSMKILESLRKKLAARDRDAATSYAAMVAKIASGGKEPAIETVAETLREASKTADNLEEDVARRARRMELVAAVARRDALKTRESALLEQIRAADAELEEADRRHTDVVIPLSDEIAAIQIEIRKTVDAAAELEQTADAALQSEIEEIRAEREECRLRTIALKEEREGKQAERVRAEQTAAKWAETPYLIEGLDRSPARKREALAEAAAAGDRIKGIDVELSEIATKDARLSDEEASLRVRMRSEA